MVSLIALPSRLDKRQLATALSSLRKGDFSVRMPSGLGGIDGQIADEFNELVEINQRLVEELERISQGVGKQGQISQRASIGNVSGAWQEAVSSVNSLIKINALTSWNAGGISSQVLTAGDGYVQAKIAAMNDYVMFGLSHGNTNTAVIMIA